MEKLDLLIALTRIQTKIASGKDLEAMHLVNELMDKVFEFYHCSQCGCETLNSQLCDECRAQLSKEIVL